MNCKILILFFSISFYSTTFSSEVKDFNEVRFFREAEDKSDKVEALSFILKELLFNPSKYWGKGYLFEGDDSDSPNAQIKSISGKDYFEIEYEYYNAQFTEKYRSKFAVHPIFASSIDKIKEENRLIFIMPNTEILTIIAHQKIVDIFNKHDVDSVVFHKMSEWYSGRQFRK